MDNASYRTAVLRTAQRFSDTSKELNLGGMGLAGEAGEACDLIKKVVFHDKPLDRDKLIKELGDVRWYLEFLCIALGTTIEEVQAANNAKLVDRYPTGFSTEAANAPRTT